MPLYFDHNATTPLDPRVLEAMLPYLQTQFGNPSSLHAAGRAARTAMDTAREQVAALVGAHPSQVIFTSGGTEANNYAVKGWAERQPPGALALSEIEHASVREPVAAMERRGWSRVGLPVDADGRVSPAAVAAALERGAGLVSLMWANNETGVVQDIAAVAETVRACRAVLHTDAVQAAGKLPLDFGASGAHLMSLSAHKLYGPKGVGALVVDKVVELEPLLHGGGQEKGHRGGTENIAAIVGFGAAAELAASELRDRSEAADSLKAAFERGLGKAVPTAVVFGERASRLPNTSFFAVPGIDGQTLIMALDRRGIAVSSGSACGSSHSEPSPVLKAMAVAPELAQCAVRVSFGKDNTPADVEALIQALAAEVQMMQRMGATAWA